MVMMLEREPVDRLPDCAVVVSQWIQHLKVPGAMD